ncbi:MAG: hypothetical protein JWM93_2283, partial [Frankiales bacterium]|nr:hypothetical protein [Frankiales bacterium]
MTRFGRTTPPPAVAPDVPAGAAGEAPVPAAARQDSRQDSRQITVPHWLATGAQYGWRLLVLAAAVVLVVYALAVVRVVVLPLIFAVMFTAVLRQPVSWLHRKGWPESVAAALFVLGALAIFVGLLTFAGTRFVNEFKDLGPRLSDGITQANKYLLDNFNF